MTVNRMPDNAQSLSPIVIGEDEVANMTQEEVDELVDAILPDNDTLQRALTPEFIEMVGNTIREAVRESLERHDGQPPEEELLREMVHRTGIRLLLQRLYE